MQDVVEKIALCVELGKINRSCPFPPEMKGQEGADEIAAAALKNGVAPDALLQGCMLGMERIGKKFAEKTAFVPNLIISAEAMKAVTRHLKPFLESGAIKRKGQFVIGTVAGDLHDIGKNLVGMVLKGGGYEVIDLGVDVTTPKFLQAIADHPGCFVGLSALLTTTMPQMQASVRAIKETSPDTKVLIGGAPVTQDFCTRIGADFYSPEPQGAVDYLNQIVG
ncbi:cobalamin-dependent protein [candidate division KSB1 bacterium]|nr:cobalamin-dependent protein [candidate division KSB1 bacterium]